MIKRVKAQDIGKWVFENLVHGRTIEFALDGPESRGTGAYSNWWFMTWVEFPQYNSMALYIDRCGGGDAVAIPYYDDEEFCMRIHHYFAHCNDDYNDADQINLDLKWEVK